MNDDKKTAAQGAAEAFRDWDMLSSHGLFGQLFGFLKDVSGLASAVKSLLGLL
ncbi:hypothetical protein [Corynebacterium phocae]|uniref:hypothetical protein n=1 Tax=Corynebacterium phocae TaxID=161895 RepID=UPI0012EDFB0A|nr:hypothetical protein [Corynebacterium phocae]